MSSFRKIKYYLKNYKELQLTYKIFKKHFAIDINKRVKTRTLLINLLKNFVDLIKIGLENHINFEERILIHINIM